MTAPNVRPTRIWRAAGLTAVTTATLCALSLSAARAQSPAPEGASAYFINIKNGDVVTSPVKVQFGLTGMGVALAGVEKEKTGHHHLLIDTKLSEEELQQPIIMDEK